MVTPASQQTAAPHHGRDAIATFFEGMDLTDVTLDLDEGALDAQSVGNGEELCKAICPYGGAL